MYSLGFFNSHSIFNFCRARRAYCISYKTEVKDCFEKTYKITELIEVLLYLENSLLKTLK